MSALDSQTSRQLSDPIQPFILVLHKGENVIERLLASANAMNIKSAALIGLGAFKDPTISYYRLSSQQYEDKTFPGIFELISFNGNLTQIDGKLFAHVHVALGDEHHQVIGGHLKNAIVGVTVEIAVIPFANIIERTMDASVGLCLIRANNL